MRLFSILSLLLFSLLFSLTSCASKKLQKSVQEEVAKEPVKTENDQALMDESLLDKNNSLSEVQRQKLRVLFTKTQNQNEVIDEEISKTKSVLFKSLISDTPNKSKLNALESQLLKLNRKKTRYSLSAYREAKAIVGKDNQSLNRSFRMIDYNKSLQSL